MNQKIRGTLSREDEMQKNNACRSQLYLETTGSSFNPTYNLHVPINWIPMLPYLIARIASHRSYFYGIILDE